MNDFLLGCLFLLGCFVGVMSVMWVIAVANGVASVRDESVEKDFWEREE